MDQKKSKKVIIFGAGISGLSAAHELAEKGYDVSVYEKFPEPGGVARSYRPDPTFSPSEYSWRGYGPFYHNVFDLMKKTSKSGEVNKNKTVYNNLSRPMNFVFTKNKGNFLDGLQWKDQMVLGMEILRVATAGPKRIDYYASINAADYMKAKMSYEGWKQFKSMFGPWVGIDPQRSSLYHVMFFIVIHFLPHSKGPYWNVDKEGEWKVGITDWSVFNKPTNEAWFDPWVNYLKENMGVKFHFNNTLHSIQLNDDGIRSNILQKSCSQKITSVKVTDERGDIVTIISDNYIMAISPFGMRDVLKNSISDSKNGEFLKSSRLEILTKLLNKFELLTQDGPHIQVSFRLGFDKKISWPAGKREPIILSDSEFNITMYSQDKFWDSDVNLGKNIGSLWSGTACVSYYPGSLYGKPLVELTREQFKNEVFHQMSKDSGFNDMLRKHKIELLPNIVYFEVWKNWKFVGDFPDEQKNITINEPKYVDSTNTRPHQPDTTTQISNLWLAGGHVKTTTSIWSMEAAAEAGRKAADMITGGQSTVYHNKGTMLETLGKIDDVLYDISLPNIADVILIIIIVLVVICIIHIFCKRTKK